MAPRVGKDAVGSADILVSVLIDFRHPQALVDLTAAEDQLEVRVFGEHQRDGTTAGGKLMDPSVTPYFSMPGRCRGPGAARQCWERRDLRRGIGPERSFVSRSIECPLGQLVLNPVSVFAGSSKLSLSTAPPI